MYRKNEFVMHRGEGVCLVEDIRTERFPGTAPRSYYILRPVYENTSTTVFLPVDSGETRLRSLLTPETLNKLPKAAEDLPSVWTDNERERQEKFSRLLREGDPAVLFKLMTEICIHRKKQAALGRKLRFFDERTLQEIERLFSQECAHVMQVEKEEALVHLRRSCAEK